MTSNTQEIYNESFRLIANSAVQDAPHGWTDLVIGYLFDQQQNDKLLLYVSKDKGKHWEDLFDQAFEADDIFYGVFECKEACEELRKKSWQSGERWSVMTLRVLSDGRFDAMFSYDELKKITPYVVQVWRGENLKC